MNEEDRIVMEFITLFPKEGICFIKDDDITDIERPLLVSIGKKFKYPDPIIKPCPFCQSKVEIFEHEVETQSISRPNYMTYDMNCSRKGCYLEHGAGWTFDCKRELIDLWNNRISTK